MSASISRHLASLRDQCSRGLASLTEKLAAGRDTLADRFAGSSSSKDDRSDEVRERWRREHSTEIDPQQEKEELARLEDENEK